MIEAYLLGGGFAAGTIFGILLMAIINRSQKPSDIFDEDPKAEVGEVLQKKPVEVSNGWLDKFRRWRQKRREKKALKKGYIRWHLVGSAFSEPRYVKPEYKQGGNIPTIEYDGGEYMFPDDALVPDAETGVYTCIHQKGRGDPLAIKPDDGGNDAFTIDAHTLKEYLTTTVTSDRPSSGWLGFDLTPKQIMMGAIGLIIMFALLEGMF